MDMQSPFLVQFYKPNASDNNSDITPLTAHTPTTSLSYSGLCMY